MCLNCDKYLKDAAALLGESLGSNWEVVFATTINSQNSYVLKKDGKFVGTLVGYFGGIAYLDFAQGCEAPKEAAAREIYKALELSLGVIAILFESRLWQYTF